MGEGISIVLAVEKIWGNVTACGRRVLLSWSCLLRSETGDVEIDACEEGVALTVGDFLFLLFVATVGYKHGFCFCQFGLVLFRSSQWCCI